MLITRYHGHYHGRMIAVGASIDALGISRVEKTVVQLWFI